MIAAQVGLRQPRLRYAQLPQVKSVKQLRLIEARQRVAQPGSYPYEDRPDDTEVWLVVFEGAWQIIPPDPKHTVTPSPPVHGCTYVMLQATDGGRLEVGGIECERK